jgi:hypothetical protein
VKVSTPHSSLVESVVASSSREGNVVRANGLSQSQKWPVGFDPSGEVVVWEQDDEIWDGEAGDYTYPLDWEMDSVEGEDPSLTFMDAFFSGC